jgi:uncharacterized protein YbjT (DUF2867 family)
MRVLVLGGYGLIGRYVVAALAAAGHEVIGAGRDIRAARRRYPFARWECADLTRFGERDWAPQLAEVDAVVNCAGVLQGAPDKLEAVHVSGLRALARAAKAAGVQRFVHVSAVGVGSSPGGFGRTKHAGEGVVMEDAPGWTILRPGLVLAPAAYGGSALLRGLAGFPLVTPCAWPQSPVQVVSAEDLADTVVAALQGDAWTGVALDLVCAEVYPLRDILARLRAWLGLPPAPIVAVPAGLAMLTARVADGLAFLGWRSPLRSTTLAQLRHGVRGDAAPADVFGRSRIRTLDQILAASPAGVQERWFAQLYFLKPLGLAVLAVFWAASGLLGLARASQAAAILAPAGLGHAAALALACGGATVDLALAASVCHRRAAPWALLGMVAVSLAYLAGATLWRPELWLDPLGPLPKVVPAMALALVLAGMMEER